MDSSHQTDPKRDTLYMIGNAHLDVVWLWNWQEGFQEIKATFRSALDRMNEDPDFVFSCSSASYYEWVEANCPAMFEEIRARVDEGRWEIVGGWYTQPDCNIPCGESYVRQGLYGQRYFLEKFGRMASVGYNVDSFGHNGTLPQILRKSRLDGYVFMRPMPLEKGLPGRVFKWRADDGSEVVAYRIPYEYNSGGESLARNVERLRCELRDGARDLMLFYGVGNHGGGPTRANIASIRALDADPTLPHLAMRRVDAFFGAVRDRDMPTVQGDLQHHASGCYSVNARVKRENMRAEQALLAAERWSAVAAMLGRLPLPTDLARGWKSTLFNQFHDILSGTSVPSAYDDASHAYGESIAIADRALNAAVQAIGWNIGIAQEDGMRPLVVFNMHAWAAKVPVEIEARGLTNDNFRLLDDEGNPVRAQRIASEAAVNGQSRLLFVADLPSLGYRTYRLYPNVDAAPAWPDVAATDTTLESAHLRVAFHPTTGHMTSLFDKSTGLEMLRRDGARLCVLRDASDTWSHNVFKFDDLIATMQAVSVALLERGPVRSTIRVRSQYGSSFVTQDFRVYADLPRVEVHVAIDWREPLTMLKVQYPVALNFRRPTYEIPYGSIEKSANGEEEPGQGFIDMTGEHRDGRMAGLTIVNDSKYSYSMDIDEMAVTLLKNAVYAHHDPKELEDGQAYRFMENGLQELTYALIPHAGSWKDAAPERRALEIKRGAFAYFETYHAGDLPQRDAFLSVDRDEVTITVLKRAEDGDAWIVRGYETTGNAVAATISMGALGRSVTATFAPHEIKTLRVPDDAAAAVVEVDLLEMADRAEVESQWTRDV